ncbi:hypothetical protein ABID58_000688 [Bradyrhizobium sp. S3.2.6]|uniref:hypothetical protein n=1 Tax=Bradyrhizobium sp. S3.2.6 TaxID=3156428 RepID=UPI003394CACB
MPDLSKLNDKKPSHWTDSGEPSLAAVKAIAGRAVTREEVRAIGRMRGQASAAKSTRNSTVELAEARLATAAAIQQLAAAKAAMKEKNAAFAAALAELQRVSPLPSVEDGIREHLRRTAVHEAAGNVVQPVEPKFASKLDAVLSGAPRRGGGRDVTGNTRRVRSIRA